MAILPQMKLFEWTEIQTLGDLKRLQLVLDSMPDEKLMRALEQHRGKGRDDYPVRAMWNSVLAGIVFQHDGVEKLRRELMRNGQLRELCGFDNQVPPPWVYTRFLKSYRGVNEQGKAWEKIVQWFGYKLHLVVDATYELPVTFKVTKASASDITEGHELLKQMKEKQPEILKTAETMAADRGYDDTKLLVKLWDNHTIKPIIDIRNMWRDGDKTRLLGDKENVAYDYKGTVYCFCPETGTRREMSNGGFEKDRNTLKKLCPAKQYGIDCKGQDQCPVAQGIRIPLSEDRRIFTPIDRASYKWEKEYDKRTAVERVNSRLDVSFCFELHTIRGMNKMKMRCGLALCVMLAMALGRIKENQADKMRSLVASV